jgi:hypothetical protein
MHHHHRCLSHLPQGLVLLGLLIGLFLYSFWRLHFGFVIRTMQAHAQSIVSSCLPPKNDAYVAVVQGNTTLTSINVSATDLGETGESAFRKALKVTVCCYCYMNSFLHWPE